MITTHVHLKVLLGPLIVAPPSSDTHLLIWIKKLYIHITHALNIQILNWVYYIIYLDFTLDWRSPRAWRRRWLWRWLPTCSSASPGSGASCSASSWLPSLRPWSSRACSPCRRGGSGLKRWACLPFLQERWLKIQGELACSPCMEKGFGLKGEHVGSACRSGGI